MIDLTTIINTVRDLIFDRFAVPAFAIKGIPDAVLNITENELVISKEGSPLVTVAFSQYDTLGKVADYLISKGIVIAHTHYFVGSENPKKFIPVAAKDIDTDFTVFRKNFYSDDVIINEIIRYYYNVLNIRANNTAGDFHSLENLLPKLISPSERHLVYWVSYHLVDLRRVYEQAASIMSGIYTDGSNYEGSGGVSSGVTTTVNIGSVFSIQENPQNGFFYEDFHRLGSDNIWGDRYSFWYRLLLYLRSKLEEEFEDTSLRKDNVMVSDTILEKPLNFRNYYDSYPFTISPLTRGIIST